MNEKKVEIIHTKPRGKDQCSPEQTFGGTPRFVSVFDTFLDVYILYFWTNQQEKKNPNQFVTFLNIAIYLS